MTDSVERLINLALYLAAAEEPVTAERIRAEVIAYPAEQDEAAFLRMFERDKSVLRAAGFVIQAVDERLYRLDRSATFASAVEFTADEMATIGAAGSAMLSDDSFPFSYNLRLALAKLFARGEDRAVAASARLADENPRAQGEAVAILAEASAHSKRATFVYTNSVCQTAPHEVEPYGLFVHDGRWYLVGRDVSIDDVRTYTVARMQDVAANQAKPLQPDFERPADFDIRAFVRLPFQYGPGDAEFEAVLAFGLEASWRAIAIAGTEGDVRSEGDGLSWRVAARSRARLLRFVIENGPGIRVAEPTDLAQELGEGLQRVIRLHG